MAGQAGHTPVNFDEVDVRSRLLELTGGRGPDGDRPSPRAAPGDPVVPQRRRGLGDRRVRRPAGQVPRRRVDEPVVAPADRAMPRAALHEAAAGAHEHGEIDPTRIITYTLPLNEAERGFEMFKNKQDDCEKVVLKP